MAGQQEEMRPASGQGKTVVQQFSQMCGELPAFPLWTRPLYTSDAADEGLGVSLGGRRLIKDETYID